MNGLDLKNFDFVWLSSSWATQEVASSIELYLDFYNIKHTKVEKSSSKLTDLVKLSLKNIPVPESWYHRKSLSNPDLYKLEEFLSFPIISKGTTGLKRNNVKLIQNWDELSRMANRKKFYLFQSFIPNEFEWSIICASGEIVSIAKKKRKGNEYRNNVHLGASETFVDIKNVPEYIKTLVRESCNILELDWCRVDVLENSDTKNAIVLEVNRFPGLTNDSPEITAAIAYLLRFIP